MQIVYVILSLCAPSENDEPLLSGSGTVSKEVTDENLLEAWHEALTKWHQNLKQRPKPVRFLTFYNLSLQGFCTHSNIFSALLYIFK